MKKMLFILVSMLCLLLSAGTPKAGEQTLNSSKSGKALQ